MLHVYLDQFAWIGLAQAAHNRPNGKPYEEALAMCRAAKERGIASFPIDLYRYWETAKRGADDSRNRLVDTIIELSDFDSMLTSHRLLDHELDVALHAKFGRPADVKPPRIFGRGIAHATNGGVHNAARPTGLRPPSDEKSSNLRADIDRQFERVLLSAGPTTHARAGHPLDLINWGDLFTQHEINVATDIVARKVPREDLYAALVHADLTDIAPAIRRRIEAAGIAETEAAEVLKGAALLQFVDALPTRRVTNVLRASKHVHPQLHQKWKTSDFVDVISLPAPVVYCDVVFTEKQWVNALTRDKADPIDRRFDTRLISNPEQLSKLLASAA